MAIKTQYQPFAAEFQKVQLRLVAILSEVDVKFTGEMKAEKIANAHRYFSKVMTALEIYCKNEDATGYKSSEAEIDSPLIKIEPAPEPEV